MYNPRGLTFKKHIQGTSLLVLFYFTEVYIPIILLFFQVSQSVHNSLSIDDL